MPLPRIPEELTRGPFSVSQALRAGLTRKQLLGDSWRPVARAAYVWAGRAEDARDVLRSMRERLPPTAAFSGRTAAWLHGLDLPPCQPIEVTVPPGAGVSNRAGVRLRRSALGPGDVVERHGLPTTSALRTAFDLARHLPLVEAVVAVDMALHARLVRLADLRLYVAERPTARHRAQARAVLGLAEPKAESPMETRLRLLLVQAGLPRPEAQAELRDERGHFVARADLYYPDQRLALEYDGGTHRDSLAADDRRQNRLLAAGYRLLRFTASDLAERPEAVVAQVGGYVR